MPCSRLRLLAPAILASGAIAQINLDKVAAEIELRGAREDHETAASKLFQAAMQLEVLWRDLTPDDQSSLRVEVQQRVDVQAGYLLAVVLLNTGILEGDPKSSLKFSAGITELASALPDRLKEEIASYASALLVDTPSLKLKSAEFTSKMLAKMAPLFPQSGRQSLTRLPRLTRRAIIAIKVIRSASSAVTAYQSCTGSVTGWGDPTINKRFLRGLIGYQRIRGASAILLDHIKLWFRITGSEQVKKLKKAIDLEIRRMHGDSSRTPPEQLKHLLGKLRPILSSCPNFETRLEVVHQLLASAAPPVVPLSLGGQTLEEIQAEAIEVRQAQDLMGNALAHLRDHLGN